MIKDKKIVVFGVSSNPDKYGHRIFKDLLNHGYKVWGINPNVKEIDGIKIYQSLDELPDKPDTAIIVIPPDKTPYVVDKCIENKIKEIWFQPGSENEEAIQKAKKEGIKVFTACFMVKGGLWNG